MVYINILDFIINRRWFEDSEVFGKQRFVCDTCSEKLHKVRYLSHPFIHLLIHRSHRVFNSYSCSGELYL